MLKIKVTSLQQSRQNHNQIKLKESSGFDKDCADMIEIKFGDIFLIQNLDIGW